MVAGPNVGLWHGRGVGLTVDEGVDSGAHGRLGCLLSLPVALFNTEAIHLFGLATVGTFPSAVISGVLVEVCLTAGGF